MGQASLKWPVPCPVHSTNKAHCYDHRFALKNLLAIACTTIFASLLMTVDAQAGDIAETAARLPTCRSDLPPAEIYLPSQSDSIPGNNISDSGNANAARGTTLTVPPFCFEGNIYWVLPQCDRWVDAMENCASAGGRLASFSSLTHQDTVLAALFAPYYETAQSFATPSTGGFNQDSINGESIVRRDEAPADAGPTAVPPSRMLSQLPYPIWFGLLQVSGQTWAWAADGTEPGWEDWGAYNSPRSVRNNESPPHECAAIWMDTKWRDRRCFSSYHGLCMAAESNGSIRVPPASVLSPPPPPESTMSDDTVSPDSPGSAISGPPPPPSLFCSLASRLEDTVCHGNKIFWLLKQTGSWNEARRACESQGGGLAVFTNLRQQQSVLSGLFGAANQLPYLMWIGVNFQESSNMWTVSGGTQPVGWTFWWGKRNGQCAIIGGECRWQQWPCSSNVRAICMGGTPSPPPLPPSPPPPPPPSPPPPSPPPPPCAMYGVCLDLTILPRFCQLPLRSSSRHSEYFGYDLDWTAPQNQHFYNETNNAIRRITSGYSGEGPFEPFTSILSVDHGVGSLHGSHGCGGSGVFKRVRYEFLFPTQAKAQEFQTWLLWGNYKYETFVDMLKAEDPDGVCAAESRVGSVYFPVNRCDVVTCSGSDCLQQSRIAPP